MLRLLLDEFEESMELRQKAGIQAGSGLRESDLQTRLGMQESPDLQDKAGLQDVSYREELSIATGRLPFPYIRRMAERMMEV
ncbi:MAG TPA: hypothetical protein DCZ91_07100, partial [Lachnospiraceae bacterium]|nr:hypothetical protein [Lachnospiraceae bacterium]